MGPRRGDVSLATPGTGTGPIGAGAATGAIRGLGCTPGVAGRVPIAGRARGRGSAGSAGAGGVTRGRGRTAAGTTAAGSCIAGQERSARTIAQEQVNGQVSIHGITGCVHHVLFSVKVAQPNLVNTTRARGSGARETMRRRRARLAAAERVGPTAAAGGRAARARKLGGEPKRRAVKGSVAPVADAG